jgi:POT family proton-dependent oligopeptide transporter
MATTQLNTDATAPDARTGVWGQLTSLPRSYWMVNIMEIIERLAYYGVRVVIPIYIAQADSPGGLHFTQTEKGTIFLWWAIVQSLVPLFSGGFADRYGYKKTIAVSITIKALGYLLMATQREFWPFLLGCCVLAFGTAIFKPGVQGTMCQSLSKKNSGVGWGMFYMLVNVGGFLGPPLAHYLFGISWPAVFYGCAVIVSLNFLMLLTYKEVHPGGEQTGGPMEIMRTTFRNMLNPRLAAFILIMSGFWLMFMQLYDLLPNFIEDWVDSSSLVAAFHLPSWMLWSTSPRGLQLSQEWMINFDSGLIILFVVLVSAMVAKMRRVTSIFIGIVVSSVGLIMSGYTTSGFLCMFGILVFAVGEMLASPKMNEYLGVIAPEGQKGLYMGYANIPLAVGWSFGSWFGGTIYESMGEKANFAVKYLATQYQLTNVPRTEAMNKLMEVSGLSNADATTLLWNTYQPYRPWFIFAGVGIASAIGMFFFARWVRNHEGANV